MALDELTADSDPIRQFEHWLAEAKGAAIPDAEAMVVATATSRGEPSARFVLLRGVDHRGFVFYTNLDSRKARELAENPRAALTFYWAELGRQVRVEGIASPVARDDVERYFATRPRDSRIGAWASPQSEVIPSRATLEGRVADLADRFGEEVPAPRFWGGYRVAPDVLEFWEHRDSRLHDRLRYTRDAGAWRIDRLAP